MTEPSEQARELWDRIAAECVAPNAQTSDDEAVQQINAALAEAWDRGYDEGGIDAALQEHMSIACINPYREETSND